MQRRLAALGSNISARDDVEVSIKEKVLNNVTNIVRFCNVVYCVATVVEIFQTNVPISWE